MSETGRLCARCGEPIGEERLDAVPQSRFCSTCIVEVEKKYKGEFRRVVDEKKIGKKGGLKTTGMDYDVTLERNQNIPIRFKDEIEDTED